MVKRLFAAAVALSLLAGPAFAMECVGDMKKIDKALKKNPQLTEEQLAKVKELRASGEALHKSGKHFESAKTLQEAMAMLGIKVE